MENPRKSHPFYKPDPNRFKMEIFDLKTPKPPLRNYIMNRILKFSIAGVLVRRNKMPDQLPTGPTFRTLISFVKRIMEQKISRNDFQFSDLLGRFKQIRIFTFETENKQCLINDCLTVSKSFSIRSPLRGNAHRDWPLRPAFSYFKINHLKLRFSTTN